MTIEKMIGASDNFIMLEMKSLFQKRWLPFVSELIFDWALIAASFVAIGLFPKPWIVIPALLLIANRQYAVSILGHEGAHFLISDNKRLNDFVAQVFCFLPLTSSIYPYRAFHFAHHKSVNSEQDTEYVHLSQFPDEWSTPISKWRLLVLPLKDVFLLRSLVNIVWMIRLTGPKSLKEALPIIAFQSVVHGSFFLLGLWWVSLVWFGCLNLLFWPFFRMRIWIEHKATPYTHRVHLNWLLRFLIAPHNIWVHFEHHESAAVPFYNLRIYRQMLGSDPKVMSIQELLKHLATTESRLPPPAKQLS